MKNGRIFAIEVLLLSFFVLTDIIAAKYSGGSGSAGEPYKISSAEDLLQLAADTNDYGANFVLAADIDLTGFGTFTTAVIAPDASSSNHVFDGVPFTGVFDGNNHTLSNLTIDTNGAENSYLGLFGYCGGGMIKNLWLEEVTVSSGVNSIYIGALAGYNDGGSISNCHSSGTIRGGKHSQGSGGLTGGNDGTVFGCHSSGTVEGGINSVYLGGLVGINILGSISGCYSADDISGDANSLCIGGLAGGNWGGSIGDCYSTGSAIGGEDSSTIGGLTGWNASGGNISSSYSTGTAAGGLNYIGGLIGANDSGSTVSDCYYLKSSGPDNGLGTALTVARMKHQSSFTGWDFNDIWWTAEGTGYPRLTWQLDITKCTITAGSKSGTDKIFISGTMGAAADNFSDPNNRIRITIDSADIVNPFVQSFPIDGNTLKKGKYNYSRTENKARRSFSYDVKTHKFAFTASNIDLSGLDCPLTMEIEIGDFNAADTLDETLVNGPKMPIPIQLMTGVKNVLRVDKCTVKQSKIPGTNTDQLSVSGVFTVENPDISMADRISENLVVTLGTQTFTIPRKYLKPGKDKFSCTKAAVTEGGAAAATFNFNMCSFTLTIKNADIPTGLGNIDFGVSFAGFDEIDNVPLP